MAFGGDMLCLQCAVGQITSPAEAGRIGDGPEGQSLNDLKDVCGQRCDNNRRRLRSPSLLLDNIADLDLRRPSCALQRKPDRRRKDRQHASEGKVP